MVNNSAYVTDGDGREFFGERGGAGCLVLSQKTGRLMLGLRSKNVEESGTWGTLGGAIEEGANPKRTAFDELFEETGYNGPARLELLNVFTSSGGGFSYHNYLAIIEEEFMPWESHELDGAQWFELGDWPEPLHFGVLDMLTNSEVVNKLTDFVKRAKAGENFIFNSEPPERTLYHCLNCEPRGDALTPSFPREVNGREERYLFAASHFTKALAFSFSYHSDRDEIICNGGIEGTPDEYVVICDRENTLNIPRQIRLFSFSSDGFEQAWCPESRQYVSTQPVPFSNAQLVFETDNIETLMHQGLQIISTSKTYNELIAEDFFDKVGKPAKTANEWIRNLVRDEGFIWENKERHINPTLALLRLLGDSNTPTPSEQTGNTKFHI